MKHSNTQPTCGFIPKTLAIAASALLAAALLAAGLAACMLPATATAFANAFCAGSQSPYIQEDLAVLAVETRDYTVQDYGRSLGGTELARHRLAVSTVLAAQHAVAEDSPKAAAWPEEAVQILREPLAREEPVRTAARLAAVSPALALDEAALSHLDDCHVLMDAVRTPLLLCALAAAGILSLLFAAGHRRLVGSALMAGPALLAALMAVLGIWAVLDFDSLFSVFHMLLFPQGNWTFPVDSLLICMLPLGFWVSMAALWLAVTLAACIIAMLSGRRLRQAS